MTEDLAPEANPVLTAGALLRKAREARGLHIAALATALKVPPRKLEALERDRYDELPDVAFTRALAKSACRALKTDPAPILALMPSLNAGVLDQVHGGLNAPFRESSEGDASVQALIRAPAFWVVLALVIAALGVYFWPATPATALNKPPTIEDSVMPPVATEPAASASVMVTPEAAPAALVPESVLPAVAAAASAGLANVEPTVGPTVAKAGGLLGVVAKENSWVQVTDAGGRTLLSRLVLAGETVGLDGPLPLRVTVGNAKGTTVTFRGVAVDLGTGARDNVARLELR